MKLKPRSAISARRSMSSSCPAHPGRQFSWSAILNGHNHGWTATGAMAWLWWSDRSNPAPFLITNSGFAVTTRFAGPQVLRFSMRNFSTKRACLDEDVYPDSSGDTDPLRTRGQTATRSGADNLFGLRGLVV